MAKVSLRLKERRALRSFIYENYHYDSSNFIGIHFSDIITDLELHSIKYTTHAVAKLLYSPSPTGLNCTRCVLKRRVYILGLVRTT